MNVVVTFDYEPEEPDDANPSGMSVDEFNRLHDALGQLGADNIDITRKADQ